MHNYSVIYWGNWIIKRKSSSKNMEISYPTTQLLCHLSQCKNKVCAQWYNILHTYKCLIPIRSTILYFIWVCFTWLTMAINTIPTMWMNWLHQSSWRIPWYQKWKLRQFTSLKSQNNTYQCDLLWIKQEIQKLDSSKNRQLVRRQYCLQSYFLK